MRGVMSPTKFAENDFTILGQYKVNLVRWQIMRNYGRPNTERDIDEYNAWFAGKLAELDLVLVAAKANGIKIVIDMHTPPGGRYLDNFMAMFYEQAYNDRFVQLWQEIATRYNGNPTVWAYDLVNEPTQSRNMPLLGMNSVETQTKAALAIRAIDPTTPIIFQPHGVMIYGGSADAYKGFKPISGIANVWYSVHLYNYTQAFVDRTACYPGPSWGHQGNKDLLRAIISPARTFQTTYGVKMYVGEFSIPVGACGATQFLSDYIDIFEEYGWDWTYHAFREAPIWDMEAPDRKALLLSWFAKN